jgi:hypothetical protein
MDALTVVVGQGMMLMGRLDGKKLFKPRVVTILKDESRADGIKVNLQALPMTPPFFILNDYMGTFPVPSREKGIIELYERVTHISVDPGTL